MANWKRNVRSTRNHGEKRLNRPKWRKCKRFIDITMPTVQGKGYVPNRMIRVFTKMERV